MSRYRKIHTRMWGDAKFRTLSESAKLLWVYLLTGPHTTSFPGLWSVGELTLSEGFGWPLERVREAFRELSERGMARADWTARVVLLPNHLKHNRPENPNVVKGWRVHWDDVPECSLKEEALEQLAAAFVSADAFTENFRQAFQESFPKGSERVPKGLPEPFRKQEQEQEQEQEPPTEVAPSCPSTASKPSCASFPGDKEESQGSQEDPILLSFPVNGKGGREWCLASSKVAEFQESFPELDILAECKRAAMWLRANPKKLKTASGMPRFLFNWLGKAQNTPSLRATAAVHAQIAPAINIQDRLKAQAEEVARVLQDRQPIPGSKPLTVQTQA